MSIHRDHFEKYVTNPAVSKLMLPRPADAVRMLMAVAAWESGGGYALHQFHGTAIGPWQMEPEVFTRTMARLGRGNSFQKKWREARYNREPEHMAADLYFAAQMARWLLWFDPVELPAQGDRTMQYSTYLRVWQPKKPPPEARFIKAYDDWGKAQEKLVV